MYQVPMLIPSVAKLLLDVAFAKSENDRKIKERELDVQLERFKIEERRWYEKYGLLQFVFCTRKIHHAGFYCKADAGFLY